MVEISKIKIVNGREIPLTDLELTERQAESDANLIQSAIDSKDEELTREIESELATVLPEMLDFISSLVNSPQSIKDANTSVKDKQALRST